MFLLNLKSGYQIGIVRVEGRQQVDLVIRRPGLRTTYGPGIPMEVSELQLISKALTVIRGSIAQVARTRTPRALEFTTATGGVVKAFLPMSPVLSGIRAAILWVKDSEDKESVAYLGVEDLEQLADWADEAARVLRAEEDTITSTEAVGGVQR